jgi:hypothetical protein
VKSGLDALKKAKNIEIQQKVSIEWIIPTSFRLWDELALALVLGNQPLEMSLKLFGVLGARQRATLGTKKMEKEVSLLERTTRTCGTMRAGNFVGSSTYRRNETNHINFAPDWNKVVVEDIKEMRFLERLMLWIPGILRFHTFANEHLFRGNDGQNDAFIQRLIEAEKVIGLARSNWVIGEVRQKVQGYKNFLDSISSDHQDFITTFVASEVLFIMPEASFFF